MKAFTEDNHKDKHTDCYRASTVSTEGHRHTEVVQRKFCFVNILTSSYMSHSLLCSTIKKNHRKIKLKKKHLVTATCYDTQSTLSYKYAN